MAAIILERLLKLSSVQQRRAACMLGAIVADTAITPLHWIYDQNKVAKLVSEGTAEFSTTSHCPFYRVAAGEPSAYGVQLKLICRELSENKDFDADKMADRIFKYFGEGTAFAAARKQTGSPKNGPWTNHNIRIFLAKYEEGEKPASDEGSKDPDGLVKCVGIVGRYHGDKALLDKVEECVRVTQSHPMAVGYALAGVKMLDHVVATGNDGIEVAKTLLEAGDRPHPFETDADALKEVQKAQSYTKDHVSAAKDFGLACSLSSSFPVMIHSTLIAKDFRSAVRNELLAAGDNCSRVNFVGAYAAAKYGLGSIPEEWVLKVNGIEDILKDIETIVTIT